MGTRTPIASPHIAMKFNLDLTFRRFEGTTVISKIPETSEESAAIEAIQNDLRKLAFSNCFAFLPRSSYHMTVIDLLNEGDRNRDCWSNQLPLDAPIHQTIAPL